MVNVPHYEEIFCQGLQQCAEEQIRKVFDDNWRMIFVSFL